MRLKLTFTPEEEIFLPFSYNENIQGFIYRHLEPSYARFLHNNGFRDGKRSFRLFTFSRLIGKVKPLKDKFHIKGAFKLIISSPHRETLQGLAESILKDPEISLGDNRVTVQSIEVQFSPSFGRVTKIEMLSPVTIYSTLTSPDGKKKTYESSC